MAWPQRHCRRKRLHQVEPAAVYGDGLSIDEGRVVRDEEEHAIGYVLCEPQPANSCLARKVYRKKAHEDSSFVRGAGRFVQPRNGTGVRLREQGLMRRRPNPPDSRSAPTGAGAGYLCGVTRACGGGSILPWAIGYNAARLR